MILAARPSPYRGCVRMSRNRWRCCKPSDGTPVQPPWRP
jgi:hypothetical protein